MNKNLPFCHSDQQMIIHMKQQIIKGLCCQCHTVTVECGSALSAILQQSVNRPGGVHNTHRDSYIQILIVQMYLFVCMEEQYVKCHYFSIIHNQENN